MPALMAAATFRIGLIMERGLMRQGISPGSGYAGPRRWDGRRDDAGHGAGGRVDLKLGHHAVVHGRFPAGRGEIPDQAVAHVARLVDVPRMSWGCMSGTAGRSRLTGRMSGGTSGSGSARPRTLTRRGGVAGRERVREGAPGRPGP